MKSGKSNIVFWLILVLLSSAFQTSGAGSSATAFRKGDPPPSRLIVKFKDNATPRFRAEKNGGWSSGVADIDIINRKYNITGVSPLEVRISEKRPGVFITTVSDMNSAEALARDYSKSPMVEYAEIDQIADFYENPDDPLFGKQWNLLNEGQEYYYVIRHLGPRNDTLSLTTGLPGADAGYDEYYNAPPDISHTAVVAIIDTGVDMDHPDLADNIWLNPDEIAGDGLDNDHNGFIDDIHGWDFGDLLFGVGDNDPTDAEGHGTHCAGIVAAVTDNGLGISGLARDCRIMALKIDPLPLVSSIAQAVIYAADNGADVINMSFGLAYPSALMEEALGYARSKGVVLCAASGNSGSEQYNYPAMSDYVIAVGATDDSDRVTSFSSYGNHLDICAPGEDILSLRADNTDMYGVDYPQEPGVHIVNTNYYVASGTSMACPHIVAAAAILRSYAPGMKPDYLESTLEKSADDLIDPYGAGWYLPGRDDYSGYGRLNLGKAVEGLPKVAVKIDSPQPFEIISGRVNIIGSAYGPDLRYYAVGYGAGRNPDKLNVIDEGFGPIHDEIIAEWNTSNLTGIYTIAIHSGRDYEYRRTVFVANNNRAEIISPLEGEIIEGTVSISGAALAPDFQKYILEYKSFLQSDGWQVLYESGVPVFNETITDWAAGDLPPGDYDLRLTVHRENGQSFSDEITITVRSLFDTDRAWKESLLAVPSITANCGDMDGDGIQEIIMGTESGIKVFNPDGTLKTEGIPTFPNNNFMIPPAVGDIDGDGLDDLVALGYDPPRVYAWPSKDRAFSVYLANFPDVTTFRYTENRFPKVFLKDITGDGRDEIFAHLPAAPSLLFIIDHDGQNVDQIEGVTDFVALDMDGDGLGELYIYSWDFSLLRRVDRDGTILAEKLIHLENAGFNCQGMSGNDLNDDGNPELLLFGYYDTPGYYFYALDKDLNTLPGWPHRMNIDPFVTPTAPVFGDLDNNGDLEYVTGFFDIDYSFVLAWNLDGSSFISGNPKGHFAVTNLPGMINMIILADINGDYCPEVVAVTNDDLFSIFPSQRLYAWDKSGNTLPGYPYVMTDNILSRNRYTPLAGDINQDGLIDLCLPGADNSLIAMFNSDGPYEECAAPVPIWRYNRRLNNVGPGLTPCLPTDVTDTDPGLPAKFALEQNYPNPFNPATTISFYIPEREMVRLEIYNILGRRVRTLATGVALIGRQDIVWDGLNETGAPVASGVYFYRLTAGDKSETRRMVLLK